MEMVSPKLLYFIGLLVLVLILRKYYQRANKSFLEKVKEMESHIEVNQKQFESLFQNHPDAIFSLNPTGHFININPHCECITGYAKDELLNRTFQALLSPEQEEKAEEHFANVLRGSAASIETRIVSKQGKLIDLHVTGVPVIKDDQIMGVIGIAKDITVENETARRLKESEQRYKALFDHNIDAVLTFDLEGHFIHLNAGTERISGYSAEELLGKSFLPLIIPEDRERVFANFTQALQGQSLHYEATIITKQGERLDLHVTVIPVYFDDQLTGVHCIAKDITEIKRFQEKINYMAYHDPLTGLPNRYFFENRIHDALEKASIEDEFISVLFMDLDRFKLVNDSYGHRVGDHLLKKVSARLSVSLAHDAAICRQGGDEFLILLEGTTQAEAIAVAEEILQSLSAPFEMEENEIFITPSIGISMYPTHGRNADALIQKADIAMYEAKHRGKNQFHVYDETYVKPSNGQLELEAQLRKALERQEFVLHYQPQVDLGTNRLSGVEALIRWKHPELGFISPSDFIPLAEETGLIIPIGEWVLRTACKQNKQWQDEGIHPMVMSVNLSIRQFYQNDLISMIADVLQETGLDPQFLELEITESMTMSMEVALSTINELKRLGVKIAIDDFGTGYSSLNYLKKLPIDRLKIDQSFVRDITKEDSNDKNIVATIITMGQNLNIKVIAEGVELEEQVEFLKQYRCDEAQGYLYSRPVSREEFEKKWYALI